MNRNIGVISRGLRAPIVREGDNIVDITVNAVLEALDSNGIEVGTKDVVAVTESVVARAQGNYATTDAIAKDVREKTGGGTV